MKDVMLFEDYNDDFDSEKAKMIEKFERLFEEYVDFSLTISPSNYRSSGSIYMGLKKNIETLKTFSIITDEEILQVFRFGLLTKKEIIQFQEKYPDLYNKYLREEKAKKFNI